MDIRSLTLAPGCFFLYSGKVALKKFTHGVFGLLGISTGGAAAENCRFEKQAIFTEGMMAGFMPEVVAELIVNCLNPINNPLTSPCNRRLVDIIVTNC